MKIKKPECPIYLGVCLKKALRKHISDNLIFRYRGVCLKQANQQIVNNTINDLIVKQELPATVTNLIITTPRTSCIYFLPKIHKSNSTGRPLNSACSCPTKLISSYLDKIMAPTVGSLPSYIKRQSTRTSHFSRFQLYTVIPNG